MDSEYSPTKMQRNVPWYYSMAFCTTYKKVPQYYHGSLDTMTFLNSSKNTMQS